MKPFDWNPEKNLVLKTQRGVSFEDVAKAMVSGQLLDTINHPNQEKYPKQKIFIVLIKDYCYKIPYIENDTTIFLKTIYPDRKFTKQFKKGK